MTENSFLEAVNDVDRAHDCINSLCKELGIEEKTSDEWIDNKINSFSDILNLTADTFEKARTQGILTKNTFEDVMKLCETKSKKFSPPTKDRMLHENKEILDTFIKDLEKKLKKDTYDKNPMNDLIKERHALFMLEKDKNHTEKRIRQCVQTIKSGENRLIDFNEKLKKDPNNKSAKDGIREIDGIVKTNKDRRDFFIKIIERIDAEISRKNEVIESLENKFKEDTEE